MHLKTKDSHIGQLEKRAHFCHIPLSLPPAAERINEHMQSLRAPGQLGEVMGNALVQSRQHLNICCYHMFLHPPFVAALLLHIVDLYESRALAHTKDLGKRYVSFK